VEQQKHAARFNNRKFLLRCIEEVLAKEQHPVEESKSDVNEDERRLLESFVLASANDIGEIDDSDSDEEEMSSIQGAGSPLSSDDDLPRNFNNSNLSALNSENAERNRNILIGGSGASTPREAPPSLNRSIRSISDFLVKKTTSVINQIRR
jgi:hypothetical protein